MIQRSSKFALVFSFFLLIFFYTSAFPRPFDDSKNLIFYFICGLLGLSHLFLNKVPNSIPSFFKACLCTYCAAFAFSLFSQPQPLGESLIEFSRLVLWVTFVFVLSSWESISLKNLLQLLAAMAWFIVPYEYLSARDIIPKYFETYGLAFPIGHVTYYGDFMALMAWVACFGVATVKRYNEKFFWALTFFLALLGLWSSGTRASILGLAAALFLSAVLALHQKILSFKKIILLFLFLSFCVMGANALSTSFRAGEETSQRLGALLQTFKADQIQQVSSGRWHMYRNTLRMIQEKPLQGWGLGTFRFAYYGFKNSAATDAQANSKAFVMHPHNEILHQWVGVGVLGTLAWIAFFGGLYFFAIQSLSKLQDSQKKLLLLGLGGLTISLVSWQFSTNYLFPVSRMVTGIFLAIILNLISYFFSGKINSLFLNRIKKYLAIFLVGFAFVIVVSHQVSLYFFQRAQISQKGAQRKEDLKLAQKLGMGSFQTEIAFALEEFNSENANLGMKKIEHLAQVYPSVPNILFYQALVKLKQNQFPEAKIILQKIIQIDPQFQEAQKLLNQLEAS